MPFLVAASGIALFSVMDAVMKSASLQVGAYNAMLFRSGFGVLLMLPLWRWSGGRWPDRPALRLHALRGAVSAGLATSFFWGLVRLPASGASLLLNAEGVFTALIAWFVALVAVVGLGATLGGQLNDKFDLPDTESKVATDLLASSGTDTSRLDGGATIVWSPATGAATDPAVAQQIVPLLTDPPAEVVP